MKRAAFGCLIAAAIAVGPLRTGAAENARLRYVASAYFDEKGNGFSVPEGIACGAGGVVVVADTGNDRLIRFTYGDKAFSGGAEVKLPQIGTPFRLQLDSKGDIYALDGKSRRIVRLGGGGEFKAAIGYDGVPAPSTVVVKDFAIDPSDRIDVLDVFSGRVLVLDAQGKFQKAMPLPADAGFISSIAADAAGTVFLLDAVKRRLFAAEKDAAAFTPLGKDLTDVVATLPTSLAASKGMLFVSEGNGSSILAFGRDGTFLSRQLTMGWAEGALNHPGQICIDDKDQVFVADRDNSRVQAFQLVR